MRIAHILLTFSIQRNFYPTLGSTHREDSLQVAGENFGEYLVGVHLLSVSVLLAERICQGLPLCPRRNLLPSGVRKGAGA